MQDSYGNKLNFKDACRFWNHQPCNLLPTLSYINKYDNGYLDIEGRTWSYCEKVQIIPTKNLPFKKGDFAEFSDCDDFPKNFTCKTIFDHYDPQSDAPYVTVGNLHYKYARPIEKVVGPEHIGKKVRVGNEWDRLVRELYLIGILPDEYDYRYVCVTKIAEATYEKTGVAINVSTWRIAKPTDAGQSWRMKGEK